jgi:hypothetical protein
MPDLLRRDKFRELVFARSNGLCVVCAAPAADAHHLIERRLFPDGGYYLDNGVALCESCHLDAEYTTISPAQLRSVANITTTVLPPSLDPHCEYDKWANVINPDGTRDPGPLFNTDQVQKVLRRTGLLGRFYH